MKLSIRALAAGAVLIGCASALAGVVAARASSTTANETALVTLPRATPAGQVTLYGHVKSLVRKNGRWEMKFDPALLLRGTAAEHIALEDTGSSDVPNDSLTFEEGHRLLTFTVASRAPVTVLTRGLDFATISVVEFSRILQGKNPNHRQLFGKPRTSGFWIRIGDKYPNPVLALDQQYQP